MRPRRWTGTSRRPPIGWTRGGRARRQVFGNRVAFAEVHLVWRLSAKCRMWEHRVVFLDVERDSPDRGDLSNEWRKSHWCLIERHDASIVEFENFRSVKANIRRSTPVDDQRHCSPAASFAALSESDAYRRLMR